MLILPIKTPQLKSGENLAKILHATGLIQQGDIVVVSSKVVANIEGAEIDLRSIDASEEAVYLSKKCAQSSAFTQAIIDESKRLNGTIIRIARTVLLTSLKPKGMKKGRIVCPNAGLDLSNIEEGYAIGWPRDLVESTRKLWEELDSAIEDKRKTKNEKGREVKGSKNIAIIISDSTCKPSRLGVTAFALTCAGIDPIKSEKGSKDLFGRKLLMTSEAIADQLATAGNFLMGNADQCTPAVIIRDHGLPFSDFCGWVDGIEPEEDIFGSMHN